MTPRALRLAAPWVACTALAMAGFAQHPAAAANANSGGGADSIYKNAAQPTWGSPPPTPRYRKITQDSGGPVYWVMPGPRELSPDVFGTPDDPKDTCKPIFAAAKQAVAAHKMPPSVPAALQKLPIVVCVPLKARSVHTDGTWWLDQPTPFSDKGRIIKGNFIAQYWQYTTKNVAGPPPKTPNKSTMVANFTDPQGHNYRVKLTHVLKPPFPGYNTEGGVMIDSYHHGLTGTGSPLMPKVKTYAANWGFGDVYIDGKLVDKNAIMHMMTTEVVRDRNYHLALNNEMPLAPDQQLIKGQATHTHLIVLPLRFVPGKGPVFEPLKTAFKLPNGKTQPFMHIMFEQDTVGPVLRLKK